MLFLSHFRQSLSTLLSIIAGRSCSCLPAAHCSFISSPPIFVTLACNLCLVYRQAPALAAELRRHHLLPRIPPYVFVLQTAITVVIRLLNHQYSTFVLPLLLSVRSAPRRCVSISVQHIQSSRWLTSRLHCSWTLVSSLALQVCESKHCVRPRSLSNIGNKLPVVSVPIYLKGQL